MVLILNIILWYSWVKLDNGCHHGIYCSLKGCIGSDLILFYLFVAQSHFSDSWGKKDLKLTFLADVHQASHDLAQWLVNLVPVFCDMVFKCDSTVKHCCRHLHWPTCFLWLKIAQKDVNSQHPFIHRCIISQYVKGDTSWFGSCDYENIQS